MPRIHKPIVNPRSQQRRLGVSLLELLAVSAILLMMAGTMATLAIGVQTSSEYQQRNGLSLQHGQVTLQRILRTLNEATANDVFPGFLSVAETVDGQLFPDALVVWHPTGAPAVSNGLPKINELIIYCPNPITPNELWEMTSPNDSRSAPSPSDSAAWITEVKNMKANASANHVVLTNLIRVASPTDNLAITTSRRGVVRFDVMLRPSSAQWQQYLDGSRTWNELPWVQGIHFSQAGLRQAWCRVEFQLRPGDSVDDSREAAIPFFGSGTVIYELHQP